MGGRSPPSGAPRGAPAQRRRSLRTNAARTPGLASPPLVLARSAPARATRASGAQWVLKLQHGASLEEALSPAQSRVGPAPGAAGGLEGEGDLAAQDGALAAQDGARVYSATWRIRPRSVVAREAPRASPAARAYLGAGLTSALPPPPPSY
jgi:hypothetical protein